MTCPGTAGEAGRGVTPEGHLVKETGVGVGGIGEGEPRTQHEAVRPV